MPLLLNMPNKVTLSDWELLCASPLFDPIWYRQTYTDIKDTHFDLVRHYLEVGFREGRDPHPVFDTKFYLQHQRVSRTTNPLVHYLRSGAVEGGDPHPLFNTQFYIQQSPDITVHTNPLEHYLAFGPVNRRDPHPLFNATFYLQTYPDVAQSGMNPLIHFLTLDKEDIRNPHPLFDATFYLRCYQDVKSANVNPLIHYLCSGAAEGRSPHPLFDPLFYLKQHPALKNTGENPLEHYLSSGVKEQCDPHPLFDVRYYMQQVPNMDPNTNPLIHYLYSADAGKYNPTQYFDTNFYLAQLNLLSIDNAHCHGMNPLVHYICFGSKQPINPHPQFDRSYYTLTYSDVSPDGPAPLSHYVRYGRREGRLGTPKVVSELTSAKLRCLKRPTAYSKIALFVTHSPHGQLKPHVLRHISALKRANIGVILIVALDASWFDSSVLRLALVDGLYIRENVGFDFAAWAHVLRLNPWLFSAEILFLVNDSIIGPLNEQHFRDLIHRIQEANADVVGLTDNHEKCWHIQSYFVAFKSRAPRSRAVRNFFKGIKNLCFKEDVINLYETRFADIFVAAGLKCEVLFSSKSQYNPTTQEWQSLIDEGFPYIKMEVLRNAPVRLENEDWRQIAGDLLFPVDRLDSTRENVIVLSHEATRSGAPILAWNIVVELQKTYNVIVVLNNGGSIEKAFHDSAAATIWLPYQFSFDGDNVEAIVERLIRVYFPKYVIANTVETRYFVPFFERKGTPIVALVHEFSSYMRPVGTLNSLFECASHIVFPASLVAEAAVKDYKVLALRNVSVLPQGVPKIPVVNSGENREAKASADPAADLRQKSDALLVVGVGSIELRKGVDIFISTAAIVRRISPDLRIRFVWIGKAFPHEMLYFEFLKEQVHRSDLDEIFSFIGELDDLEPVFEQADLWFLPSRLDPLPNVGINAASKGVPIICFDGASGIAEILKENAETRELVAPHLDPQAAAQLICDLADHPRRRAALSKAVLDIAKARFNMENYVKAIDALAKK